MPVGFDQAQLPVLPAGEDPDLGGNPASAPVSAKTPSTSVPGTASADGAATPTPAPDVTFVDGPGAHAPTTAQANPAKTIWLKR